MAYAGGTELLLAMKEGLLRPTHLVDLKAIKGLGSVEESDGEISIGALVTHTEAADDPNLRSRLPGLARVLEKVGNPRVRATGTLVGNLCFAEPRSDVASALIALGGEVEIASSQGRRRSSVEDFVVGPYTTALGPSELVTRIMVPVRPLRFVYLKHQTAERPALGVALAMNSHVTLVVGAVGLSPQIFRSSALSDLDPSEVTSGLEVVPDLTGSEDYKRHLVGVYLRRALQSMAAQP
jgi:carbon-monoxide dehydrogenase medium subunit